MKHAPKGYRITQYLDGFYHVYRIENNGANVLWNCIGEELSRNSAVSLAVNDKAIRAKHAELGIIE